MTDYRALKAPQNGAKSGQNEAPKVSQDGSYHDRTHPGAQNGPKNCQIEVQNRQNLASESVEFLNGCPWAVVWGENGGFLCRVQAHSPPPGAPRMYPRVPGERGQPGGHHLGYSFGEWSSVDQPPHLGATEIAENLQRLLVSLTAVHILYP